MKIQLSEKYKIPYVLIELSYEEVNELVEKRFFPLSVTEQIFKLRYYYKSNGTLTERTRTPKYYLILTKNNEWQLCYKYENTQYKRIKLIDDIHKEYPLL